MECDVIYEESSLHNAVQNQDIKLISELLDQDEFIDMQDEFGNTPLHLAACLGNTKVVDLLLEHCANLDLENKLGETPIQIAINKRNEAIVCKLSDSGASFWCTANECGHPAVTLAESINFDVAADIISKKIDIYHRNKAGNTCHHLLVLQKNSTLLEKFVQKWGVQPKGDLDVGRCALQLSIEVGFDRGFELLLEGTTNPLHCEDFYSETPLHTAVLSKNCTIIEQLMNKMPLLYLKNDKEQSALDLAISNNLHFAICLFLKKGIDLNISTYSLHAAVLQNNESLLKDLINNGFEINAGDIHGRTPLHWAIMLQFATGVNILLSKGADVNVEDEFGNTALYYSILGKCLIFVEMLVNKGADINHQNIDRISSLHLAVMENFEDCVSFLLSKGVDITKSDEKARTVLHTAVLCGHSFNIDIINLLLMQEDIDLRAEDIYGYTALDLAVKQGLETVVDLLLKQDINVNLQHWRGLTILQTAVCQAKEKRSLKIINKICEKGADIEIKNENSETLLHLAAYHKYTEALKLLLEKGASRIINEVDKKGNTALHCAVKSYDLDEEESKHVVSILLNNGADLNIRNQDGKTVIHIAFSIGYASVVSCLIEKGANVHELDNNQSSVLHKALDSKNIKLVELLLGLGLDPNLKDRDGRRPLFLAVRNSFEEAVKLLLEYGADDDNYGLFILPQAASLSSGKILEHLIKKGAHINKQTSLDMTPSKAYHKPFQIIGFDALHSAVYFKQYQNVKLLLKNNFEINNVNNHGNTALHEICLRSDFDKPHLKVGIIKLLVEHGADVNAKAESNGRTVLHMATMEKIVKLFLDKNPNVNEQDNHGNSPLHLAVSRKKVGIVKLLIESGANLSLKNNYGTTALHLAVQRCLTSCLDLILKHSRDINAQDSKGYTCLHYAVLRRNLETLKILLKTNIDLDIKNNDKQTATCIAASFKNFQSGVRLLLEKETRHIGISKGQHGLLQDAVLERNRTLLDQLIKRGVGVNYKQTKSALHMAVLRNFEFGVEVLTSFGACAATHVNCQDQNGNTPLHLAAIVKNTSMMKILLEHGAFLHCKNNDNRTALHLASLIGFEEGVKFLIDQGGLLDLQDCDGNTPLHLAMSKRNMDSVIALIQSGARMDINNRQQSSFFSMRLESKQIFSIVEDLFLKLKIACVKNIQDLYDVRAHYESPDRIAELESKCYKEVVKIKSHPVGRYSLLDVLTEIKDPSGVFIGHLRAIVDSASFHDDFPNYALLLKSRCRRLERRYNMLNEASAICLLVENCSMNMMGLPVEMKRKILSELSDEDLASVLEAMI